MKANLKWFLVLALSFAQATALADDVLSETEALSLTGVLVGSGIAIQGAADWDRVNSQRTDLAARFNNPRPLTVEEFEQIQGGRYVVDLDGNVERRGDVGYVQSTLEQNRSDIQARTSGNPVRTRITTPKLTQAARSAGRRTLMGSALVIYSFSQFNGADSAAEEAEGFREIQPPSGVSVTAGTAD